MHHWCFSNLSLRVIVLKPLELTASPPITLRERPHTTISTIVHAEVVCAPKILPIGIFLSIFLSHIAWCLCGDGVSMAHWSPLLLTVERKLTSYPSFSRGRVQFACSKYSQKEANLEIQEENARFQRNARGVLVLRHVPGCNDLGS